MANSSTRTPGRPSGVASGGSSASMPASQPQPITEVAKPVMLSAACRAQRGVGGGDQQRGRAHVERLGEAVVDRHAVADQRPGTPAHASNAAGSGSAKSGTSNAVAGTP